MPITNQSYVLDNELSLYVNYRTWRQLCTQDEEGISPDDPLTGVRLDRSHAALNFGKSAVDTALGEVYIVPLVTEVNEYSPIPLVKHWNIRFARWFLLQLHTNTAITRSTKEVSEVLDDIFESIRPFVDPDGYPLFGYPRRGQPGVLIRGGKDKEGTIFDAADYWSRQIMPVGERGNFSVGY